ncbi:unnamed protein product [Prorocentrum cordatum]|uniref:Sodium/calcium exchanger membrane region domain-containing protein n=1 Tax=Prorocentrum cordatum TaxID=2364126 RepID=A0ABN9UA68_9DINO|nr:unnamed protein product [Polarella glacialis]
MARSPRLRNAVVQVSSLLLTVFTLCVLFVVFGASKAPTWARRESCSSESKAEALFDYSEFYSCSEILPQPLKMVLLLIWLLLVLSLLATTADLFFVPQLEALSCRLGLSEDVAGVTLLALGNGMPDVMTATSAINKAEDLALSLGELFGAGNFILSFVLGCVILCQRTPVEVDRCALFRDAGAYVCVIVLIVAITVDNEVSVTESFVFVVVYVAYIVVVVFGRRCQGCGPSSDGPSSEPTGSADEISLQDAAVGAVPLAGGHMATATDAEAPPGSLESPTTDSVGLTTLVQSALELPFTLARHVSIPSATWGPKRRLKAAACPVGGMLTVLLSFGGWAGFQRQCIVLPAWALCALAGGLCGLGVLAFSSPDRPPRWHVLLLLLALVSAVSWFNLLANECVALLELFGTTLGISSTILGITVLAWGNSVGDLVADTAVARQGKVRTAVAGCFGSPLLSDLLGLGVSLSSYTLSTGPLRTKMTQQTKIAAGFALLSVLTTVTGCTVHGYRFPKYFAIVLFCQYAAFLFVSIVLEI